MGSAIGEITGANKRAARAAHSAAMAQQATARRLAKQQEELIKGVQGQLEDPEMLRRRELSISQAERQLGRQEELIKAIDPALKEAALQAAGLLRGEDAQVLAPIRRQRDRQRKQLLDTLREQLGPAAQTSSAGQQALNRFDAETDQILSGAQDTSLGRLLGVAQSSRPDLIGEAGRFGQVAGQGFADQLQFGQFASNVRNQSGQNLLSTAGAQHTGDLMRAKQMQSIGGEAVGIATSLGSSALMGHAFGKALGGGGFLSGLFGGGGDDGGGGINFRQSAQWLLPGATDFFSSRQDALSALGSEGGTFGRGRSS